MTGAFEKCERCRATLLWQHGALVCARRGCESQPQPAGHAASLARDVPVNPRSSHLSRRANPRGISR
jgi:hypothetical protein